jgi:hypothetical protein
MAQKPYMKAGITTTASLGQQQKQVIDEAKLAEETKEEVTEKKAATPIVVTDNVKIKPNATFSQFIGAKKWHFTKGKIVVVPRFVKDVLQMQNSLDVL